MNVAKQAKIEIPEDHDEHKFHWLLEEKNRSHNKSQNLQVRRLQSLDSLLDKSESDNADLMNDYSKYKKSR